MGNGKSKKSKEESQDLAVNSHTNSNSNAMAGSMSGSEMTYVTQKNFSQNFAGQSLDNSTAKSIGGISTDFASLFPGSFISHHVTNSIENQQGVQQSKYSPRQFRPSMFLPIENTPGVFALPNANAVAKSEKLENFNIVCE